MAHRLVQPAQRLPVLRGHGQGAHEVRQRLALQQLPRLRGQAPGSALLAGEAELRESFHQDAQARRGEVRGGAQLGQRTRGGGEQLQHPQPARADEELRARRAPGEAVEEVLGAGGT
ncbi:hypothetical protein ACLESD_43005, partial [Pyxidicoccus sp. 3LFB2]